MLGSDSEVVYIYGQPTCSGFEHWCICVSWQGLELILSDWLDGFGIKWHCQKDLICHFSYLGRGALYGFSGCCVPAIPR